MTGRHRGAVVGLLVVLIKLLTLLIVVAIVVVRTAGVVVAGEIRHHRARRARTMYEWTPNAPPCSTWFVPVADPRVDPLCDYRPMAASQVLDKLWHNIFTRPAVVQVAA